MGKPVEQNPSDEGRGTGGNATGKDLYPGKLKDNAWKVIVGLVIAVLLTAIAVAIL